MAQGKKHTPGPIVSLLRQIEVGIATEGHPTPSSIYARLRARGEDHTLTLMPNRQVPDRARHLPRKRTRSLGQELLVAQIINRLRSLFVLPALL
jgi:hypothetical protein